MTTLLRRFLVLFVMALPPAAAAQGDTAPVPAPQEDASLLPPPPGRAAFYYLVLDQETKANRPDLTVEKIKQESLNDLLVVNYFNEKAEYSNYQRAVLRRSIAQLSSRLVGRDAKLLDVMAFAADETPVYKDEALKAYRENTLGGYASAVDGDPVLPYAQVFIHGQLVYDFAVTLNAESEKDVSDNALVVQYTLQKIVGDLQTIKPLFDEDGNIR